MKHLILIDPLEKLMIKKDTTIQFALALKEFEQEVYFVYEEDFSFSNDGHRELLCRKFNGSLGNDGISPETCEIVSMSMIELDSDCYFHMRLDPPFDTRYLRILWILAAMEKAFGCHTINNAEAIAITNEKLDAYLLKDSVASYVGGSLKGVMAFCERLKARGHQDLVIKPLDLYQGIGVEKISINNQSEEIIKSRIKEFGGALVAQPYLPSVEKGEIRSVFFAGTHLGSILKRPKKGDFISNIAHGATFEAYQLTKEEFALCEEAAIDLHKKGLPWVAFDLLDGKIQELNITCPGLLVEVSKANHKNLSNDLIEIFLKEHQSL